MYASTTNVDLPVLIRVPQLADGTASQMAPHSRGALTLCLPVPTSSYNVRSRSA